MQFYVSNYMGPELTDIMSSLTCIIVMVVVLKLWTPKNIMRLEGDKPVTVDQDEALRRQQIFMAWMPYLLLVVFVLVVGRARYQAAHQQLGNSVIPASLPADGRSADGLTATRLMVPGLHNLITRIPPVVAKPSPYAALYELNWLSASGTACFLAILATALVLRVRPGKVVKTYVDTFKQLKLAMLTIALHAGARVSDELLGDDLHPRAGAGRHRVVFPVLQRRRRLARGVPDRQRHVGQRACSAISRSSPPTPST